MVLKKQALIICLCPWNWKMPPTWDSAHSWETTRLSLSVVLNHPADHLWLCPWSWINQPTTCGPVRGPESTILPLVALSVVLNHPADHLWLSPWYWKDSTTCVSVRGAEPGRIFALWGTFPMDHFSDVGWPLILSGDRGTCLNNMYTMQFLSTFIKIRPQSVCHWVLNLSYLDHISAKINK